MAVAHAGGREASLFYGKISGSSPNMERILRRIMKQHGVSREDVLIGYEAGPCGFVLAKRGSANVTSQFCELVSINCRRWFEILYLPIQ